MSKRVRGVVLCLILGACTSPDKQITASDLQIRLRWVQGQPDLQWEHARQGVLWALSSLGGVPKDDVNYPQVLERTDAQVVFDLDLSEAGLPESAWPAVAEALEPLRDSDELAAFGSVDVGRFLMRTLYSPWRYYAITQVCPTFDGFESTRMVSTPVNYGVTVSQLTEGDRLITFNPDPVAIRDVAFVSLSGPGSLQAGTFEAQEIEVLDVMPNGRQRFAIYDLQGELQVAADPEITPAGQPGKCMWCHESSLQLGTSENPGVSGMLSFSAFQSQREHIQHLLLEARAAQVTSVDFETSQVHTWSERLVVEFQSPSEQRLAGEWDLSIQQVQALLADEAAQSVQDEEYPQFGQVYDRAQMDRIFLKYLGVWSEDPGHMLFGSGNSGYEHLPILPDERELDPHTPNLDGSHWRDQLTLCGD